MPAKKAAKSRSAAKKKSSPGRYRCPNPGPKLNLRQMILRMAEDRAFAVFIRDLLQRACKGDQDAIKCLASYFQPRAAELDQICLGKRARMRLLTCTEQNLLIEPTAYALSIRKESTAAKKNT